MPNFTKKAIKETFLRQLNERPLNQITVKDIVEECGINRNSFYYHFEDLPALVEEILDEQLKELIQHNPTIGSLAQGFDVALSLVMRNKRAIFHIYHSLSRDVFEQYLMEICQYIVTTYVDSALDGKGVSESDKAVIIRYHKCVCFGSIIDWLSGGMKEDIAAYFHRIYQLKKDWPEDIVRRCQEN